MLPVQLDHLTECLEVCSTNGFQSCLDNARAADTNVDDAVCLCYAMESSCHERVIIRRIAEHDQFRAAKGILISGSFCCLQNDLAH